VASLTTVPRGTILRWPQVGRPRRAFHVEHRERGPRRERSTWNPSWAADRNHTPHTYPYGWGPRPDRGRQRGHGPPTTESARPVGSPRAVGVRTPAEATTRSESTPSVATGCWELSSRSPQEMARSPPRAQEVANPSTQEVVSPQRTKCWPAHERPMVGIPREAPVSDALRPFGRSSTRNVVEPTTAGGASAVTRVSARRREDRGHPVDVSRQRCPGGT
jgi:hypothetical protein